MNTELMAGWVDVANRLPPEGEVVLTKIDDAKGCRNEWPLKWINKQWILPNGFVYVRSPPTCWLDTTPFDSWFETVDAAFRELDAVLQTAEEHARQALPDSQTANRLASERRLLGFLREPLRFVTQDMDKLLAEQTT